MNKKILIIFVVIGVICGACAAVAWFVLRKPEPIYTEYEILKSSERADSISASYAKYGDGFLRYSRDGIAYYNADNIAQWNASYEMQKPIIDIRKEYCAVASAGESKLYVFNKNGLVVNVDTVLAIVDVSVSDSGYVAVVLEDSNTEYIDMYDSMGEKVYHIKSAIDGNGIPTAIAISNDGAKLMVAYTVINGNELSSSIAFYNFGEVGQNVPERLVGGYEQYGHMIIPTVEFLDDTYCIAVGTGLISLYSIGQYPKLIADITPEDEIHSVFYSDKYFAIVYPGKIGGGPYYIDVFDTKGSKLCTIDVDKSYSDYEFVGKNILMRDSDEMKLVSFEGVNRFNYTFELKIDALIPVLGDDTYVYINSRKVQKIKLR